MRKLLILIWFVLLGMFAVGILITHAQSNVSELTGFKTQYSTVPNGVLTNSAITVGGQTCTLGSSCSPATTVNGTTCTTGSSCTVSSSPSTASLTDPYILDASGNMFGPIFKSSNVNSAVTTWVNQGAASVTNHNGALVMAAPGTSGDNIRSYVASLTVPYTITASLNCFMFSTAGNAEHCGIVLRESGSGKLIIFGPTSAGNIDAERYNNNTTYAGSNDVNPVAVRFFTNPIFLKIVNNSSNRVYYQCVYADTSTFDGCIQVGTVTSGSFLTENQYGIMVDSSTGTNNPVDATFFHIKAQ